MIIQNISYVINLVIHLASNTYTIHIGAPTTDKTNVGLTPIAINRNVTAPHNEIKTMKNVPSYSAIDESFFKLISLVICFPF